MIEEWNRDRTGFARFSDDRVHRYRLERALTPAAIGLLGLATDHVIDECSCAACVVDLAAPRMAELTRAENVRRWRALRRVVFVMLNPSTADAFKLDPTIFRCVQFAHRWGADVLEVVNLFSLRSPYPETLRQLGPEHRGGDFTNDAEIEAACTAPGVTRVVAAWGRHGTLGDRQAEVIRLLASAKVKLHTLRALPGGDPSHPLARGKSYIPIETEPKPWP